MNQPKNTNSPVILIADDDRDILSIIETILQEDGYQTLAASDGEQAVMLVQTHAVQLLILDIMMPKMNGLQAATQIRRLTNAPILMLSAKGEQSDRVIGLNMGADDYLTKPFNPLELIARVKSQLRRFHKFTNNKTLNDISKVNENIIQIDDLIINLETHEVILNEEILRLTPTEFDILSLLAKNRGKVFSIENIYESVWNQEFMASDNTVMVHIRKIREKIEQDPRNPRFIKTVWGVGYKVEK